jgi:hypothetical protein
MAEEKQIELELDRAEDTEVEVPQEEKKEEAPVVADSTEESTDDNFDKAETATQKRIDRLTKKMREAERQREEALKYAQGVQAESTQLKQRMEALDTNYVTEYSTRVESQLSSAEDELAKAMEVGDTKGVVESQRKITRLAIENDRAEQAKMQQEQVAKQREAAPQQPVAPTQQPLREPDAKAKQWAHRNDWFGNDEAMTYAAFGVHKRLVEEEGFDPKTDEYYTELDKRMQTEFPHKLNGNSKRPAQTVASVSRGSSGRSSGKKVRLTPSQVAIAKKLGVPLEEYAKYVKE